jgi:magnesium chelatase family protein
VLVDALGRTIRTYADEIATVPGTRTVNFICTSATATTRGRINRSAAALHRPIFASVLRMTPPPAVPWSHRSTIIMFSQLRSASTLGINAFLVDIETHVDHGLFSFSLVGLPDGAVRESRDRVGAAIRNSGYLVPAYRYTVNLAPADVRKEGSAFDLPIALGVLIATHQIPHDGLDRTLLVGELALDGSLRPVHGVLPITLAARAGGIARMIVPRENAEEAALVDGVEVVPSDSLRDVVRYVTGALDVDAHRVDRDALLASNQCFAVDLAEVKGQENVKRAFEVAAAGGHNVIMIGPPGAGKTMIARRLPTILPPMSFEEALETTKIHSVAGLLSPGTALITTRPFRSPHHTISDAALVGGGVGVARPGEISLAHHGVLFLDELPEFARNVLEVLRQPLEENRITISRTRMSLTFPCNFQLVASMNPCPCGNFGNPNAHCDCNGTTIQRYMGRVSGPLLDRIDIHVEVTAVRYQELAARRGGEPSEAIRERVVAARAIQAERFGSASGLFKNADMTSQEIRRHCTLDADCQELLRQAMTALGLSARAYDRILKVGRTIADLAGVDVIRPEHLSEAIQYRSLDRQFWNA